MDGNLAWSGQWGSKVPEADCPDRKIGFGHSWPGWTYGAEVEVYDMRWYVNDVGARLPDKDIFAMARRPQLSPGLTQLNVKCLPGNSAAMLDSNWMDANGNGCEWYYTHKAAYPHICNLRTVQSKCGLSCRPAQACFPGQVDRSIQHYFVWDRIRRLQPSTVNGTICLGSSMDKNDIVKKCLDWVNGLGGELPQLPWAENYLDLKGRKINVTDCYTLGASVNEYCAFDMAPVEQFTESLKGSNGDFTMSFWIKPVVRPDVEDSLHTDGKFYPHVSLYSGLSPPKHHLSMGLWANPDGEIRLFSDCAPETGRLFDNVEMMTRGAKAGSPSAEDWTFVAITRRNSSQPMMTAVSVNLGRFEEQSYFPMCLFNESSLFTAIEVNYPVLMSPIMLVPQAMMVQDVQQLYLTSYADMKQRTGPATDEETRARDLIDVVKMDFSRRSVLVAPPIVTSMRSHRTAQCHHSSSTKFIRQQHSRTVESACSTPYRCSESVMQKPELTVSCTGDQYVKGDTAFGIELVRFKNEDVVVDFLYRFEK
jgi:hypothetical protein